MQTHHHLESPVPRAGLAPLFAPAPPTCDLRAAYATRGGVVHSEDFTSWLRSRSAQPISQVARWIVAREVVSFHSRGVTLFPLFQFDLATLALRPAARVVIAELAPALDDEELAEWFVRPNSFLAATRPLDLLDTAWYEVLQAARADRFVVLG